MTDKKERIEQFITIQQRTITTRDYEVNDEIICKDYPLQKAIEVMAKANWIAVVCAKNQIVPTGVSKEEWDAEWAKLRSDYKKVYYSGAEASLNVLLEGGK